MEQKQGRPVILADKTAMATQKSGLTTQFFREYVMQETFKRRARLSDALKMVLKNRMHR